MKNKNWSDEAERMEKFRKKKDKGKRKDKLNSLSAKRQNRKNC
jgi:hypothetical protein